ncbi:putative Ig domain-containing protein [Rhodopila sp.]|uniref:putative Ig domain-containing protein n=1 Tax=Rhodopila sp. TaxID=2480087 RepID=UPI003D14E9AB
MTAAGTNPAYLVLTALDRDEYIAGASAATGNLSGDGQTTRFSSIGGDARGTGLVFTYQASTGRYYNSTYGYFDQLTYNASGSLDDVTNLSLFGTNSLATANAYAANAYDMMQVAASGYLGSATVVTEQNFIATVPAQATPDSIAAVADSFVGQAWNMNGCWVLASTIAAEAGASLPVVSTAIGLPGQANGEWIVAFDGPAGQSGNWQSLVKQGEIVVIGTSGGGGHITTCVSGSGGTAMLVDNITYVNGSGQVQNSAHDGSSSDVTVAAPHQASQEWSGVAAASVVIYELDTPIVTDSVSADGLAPGSRQALSLLFAATDPGNKAITEWQAYDTATSDMLVLNGIDDAAHSAASALTATSLAAVSLLAGSTQTTDTLDVRAFNGSYWGDWEQLAVSVAGFAAPVVAAPVVAAPVVAAPAVAAPAVAAPAVAAPVVATQTANQTWTGGRAIALALPATTFHDPQNQTLTYTAKLSNGQALPSWLTFNPNTATFSGLAPPTAQTLRIAVTATDTSGLSASDTFAATIIGAPVAAAQTANQTWTAGQRISLALPAATFTDPQNEALVYTATQSNGQALPSWLTFNAATETFSGTTPATAQSLGIKVTATDASGLTGSETFTANVQAPATVARPAITTSAPTPNQVWAVGGPVALALPSNTFTDALGLKMTFAAFEVSGPNITSWLRFNPATDTFSGNAPASMNGSVELAVVATDAARADAVDLFNVTFAAASGHTASAVQVMLPGLAAQFAASQPVVSLGFHF